MKDSLGDSITVTAINKNGVDPNAYTKVPSGMECLGVTVDVKNGSSAVWLIPLDDVGVVDSAGQTYFADNGYDTCLTSDTIDNVMAGGQATGTNYFEVPSTGALDVTFTPQQEDLGQVFKSPVG